MKNRRNLSLRLLVLLLLLIILPNAQAYEVAFSLGSTAPASATSAMVDRSQWPVVADMSWGPLANLSPIVTLDRVSVQEPIFGNFKQQQAIAEIPYSSINNPYSAIDYIETFGLTVPYLFVPGGSAGSSMLTQAELLEVRGLFPDKKIIMNTYSWDTNRAHVESVKGLLDGVCIEYYPQNTRANIVKHVAPFAKWAYNNDKILIFLMPPLPEPAGYVNAVTQLAQIVYDENNSSLPKGWMKSEKFIFSPANYTFGDSSLNYISEDSENSVLAAAKQLLLMRPELDAELDPELSDVVYGLQVLAGRQAKDIYPEVYDTNGDEKVGMEDVLYKLSKLAQL